jgi:hypothetical protein
MERSLLERNPQRNARRKAGRKRKGSRDERAFWRLERTEAGGVEGASAFRGRSRKAPWSRRGKFGRQVPPFIENIFRSQMPAPIRNRMVAPMAMTVANQNREQGRALALTFGFDQLRPVST